MRKDYNILEKRYEDVYMGSNFSFSSQNGFAVAAAMSKADASLNVIEDPEIGQLKFVMKTWKSSTSAPQFIELKQR